MKFFKTLFMVALLALAPMAAFAGKSAHFKGVYEILSETEKTLDVPFFLFDNDTLGVIWSKYAEGPLPADLEKYREEQTILAGFSNRPLIFLALERGAMVLPNYLAMEGGEGEKLEMRRRPDGQMDMAVKEGARTTIYLLAAPTPVPDSN